MSSKDKIGTVEPQYESCFALRDRIGLTPFGVMSNETWFDDPKRLTFLLSRYKFVSKLLAGKQKVLEVGCADAFGTRIVQQSVPAITAVDFDALFIEDAKKRAIKEWPLDLRVHDMILNGPIAESFDAAYALDVLEHIEPKDEHTFVKNISGSVHAHGVVIFGSPSLESQQYASPRSKAGHVNCKTGVQMKELGERFFYNSFVFSMNDEVVHTGFYPMAQYLFLVGITPK